MALVREMSWDGRDGNGIGILSRFFCESERGWTIEGRFSPFDLLLYDRDKFPRVLGIQSKI